MSTLVTVITLWLAANFGLPADLEPPRIERKLPAEIVAMRYGAFLSAGARGNPSSDAEINVVSVYHDATKTIYLPKGWTGSSPEEASILVHELVHHMQNMAGMRYQCAEEREELAYAAQDRWLQAAGQNLESAFGIDGFALLVKTKCLY